MSNTSIEWAVNADGSAGQTWNPTRGCSPISPGCKNCYAERMAARNLPGMKSPTTGEPFAIMKSDGPHWTGKMELIEHMLDIPLRRKRPTTYFVNSMSDLFHRDLSIADQERVFRVMLSAPQHTYQILTKRAEEMCWRVPIIMNRIFGMHWQVPPFIWLGVSIEDQQRANERLPFLLRTPAAVRFLSMEPLLEDVQIMPAADVAVLMNGEYEVPAIDLKRWLHLVIVGGESGPGARPCGVDWIRSIVNQCGILQIPCFVKQLGRVPFTKHEVHNPNSQSWTCLRLKDRKGGTMSEWPVDLRIREMPAR